MGLSRPWPKYRGRRLPHLWRFVLAEPDLPIQASWSSFYARMSCLWIDNAAKIPMEGCQKPTGTGYGKHFSYVDGALSILLEDPRKWVPPLCFSRTGRGPPIEPAFHFCLLRDKRRKKSQKVLHTEYSLCYSDVYSRED